MTITTQEGEFAVALQWGKYENGYPKPVAAQGKVTFVSNPSDADTLTIGAVTYTFKTTPAAAGDILIGTTKQDTIDNLVAAIKGTGGSGYYAATKPSLLVTADTGVSTLFLEYFIPGTVGNSATLSQSGGSTGRYTLTAFAGGRNGGAARSAAGRVGFAAMPANADTLVVGSTTYTFSTSSNSGDNINISLAGQNTTQLLAATVAARLASNAAVTNISYSGSVVSFSNASSGTAGNSTVLTLTLTTPANGAVTGSGTLTGGAAQSAYPTASLSWYRLRALGIDYADAQMQDVIPQEIGSTLTPTGAYKQGVAVGGGATILPRMQDSMGPILLATFGASSTTTPASGVGQHTFTFNPNEITMPWFAARRMIPGRDNIFGEGLVGYDNKINSLTTTLSATNPMSMEIQMVGRVPKKENHPETWAGATFEDYKSIPMACKTTFSLPTIVGLPSPLPVTTVQLQMANVTTGPREEMIIGDYYMDDIVARQRVLTIRFTYKWESPKLSQLLYSGAIGGTEWTPTPFTTETNGSNYAFDLLAEAPYNITGTSTAYSLRVRANHVFWQATPVRMRAGDIVMMEVVGTVLYSASGYCEFILTNGNTVGYSVPSEP